MANYWMIPRPKRKLLPVVDVLSTFSLITLDQLWQGEQGSQLNFEGELERAGIKAPGPRRDQQGSGARTYEAWLHCLGLIFTDSTKVQRLTLAGEALLRGEPPVQVMTDQLLKLQYPSAYSVRTMVRIDPRFRVRPFRFLLALLMHPDLRMVTEAEIARFVVTLADRDDKVEEVAQAILRHRSHGDAVLPDDFADRYPPRGGRAQNLEDTLKRLHDVANTFVNFLEYTQLIARDSGVVSIEPDREQQVLQLLSTDPGLIPRPEDEEYFQRRFGLDRAHQKDTRKFQGTSVSPQLIAERLAVNEFLRVAAERPVTRITGLLVDEVAHRTGISRPLVEQALQAFPQGALGAFEAAYLDMARAGREDAREFELATQQIFGPDGFGLRTAHVGTQPRHPDVLVASDTEGYAGIIDSKAYVSYSISNDHRNRMLHNYIPTFRAHAEAGREHPLRFWGYVAGGLKSTVDEAVASMSEAAGVMGFAVTANGLVQLLDRHRQAPMSHAELLRRFACGGVIPL